MKFLALFLLVAVVAGERVRYDNYKVFKVHFSTEDQFEKLMEMKVGSQNRVLDVWQLSRAQKYADVMVMPELIDPFIKYLTENKFTYEVMIEDLQRQMEENQ